MALGTSGASRISRSSTRTRNHDADGIGGEHANVGSPERIASAALGAALIGLGLRRRDPAGVAAAFLGGMLLHRGASGQCSVYHAMGVSTGSAEAVLDAPPRATQRPDVTSRAATVNARKAIKVERTVLIDLPRAELYRFWRDFSNLPRFMEHLVSVRCDDSMHSHWIAKGPAGSTVEWDAEIVNDVPDSIIAWKSVHDATVPNAGAVNFSDAPGGRGTVVKVTLDYEPPGGRLGNLVARLSGEDPDRQVREDLRKFKQLMETGEITTSARRVADSAYVGSTPRE